MRRIEGEMERGRAHIYLEHCPSLIEDWKFCGFRTTVMKRCEGGAILTDNIYNVILNLGAEPQTQGRGGPQTH